jgi:PPOX class probable F420-dependent enzyme
MKIDDATREFISSHRVARLATADVQGQTAVVPICYVLDGETIYSPIDEKPKRVAPSRLKRVRNIRANPRVSLVIDDYSEDWSKLSFVLITGRAELGAPQERAAEHRRAVALLREKYEQYRLMMIEKSLIIKITFESVKRWDASESATREEFI